MCALPSFSGRKASKTKILAHTLHVCKITQKLFKYFKMGILKCENFKELLLTELEEEYIHIYKEKRKHVRSQYKDNMFRYI
jgi:hypothetical protein